MLKHAILLALFTRDLLAAPSLPLPVSHRTIHTNLFERSHAQARDILSEVTSALAPGSVASLPGASAAKSALHNSAPPRPAIVDDAAVPDALKDHLPRDLSLDDELPCSRLNSRAERIGNGIRSLGEGILEKVNSVFATSLGDATKTVTGEQAAVIGDGAAEAGEDHEDPEDEDLEEVEDEGEEAETGEADSVPTRHRTRFHGRTSVW